MDAFDKILSDFIDEVTGIPLMTFFDDPLKGLEKYFSHSPPADNKLLEKIQQKYPIGSYKLTYPVCRDKEIPDATIVCQTGGSLSVLDVLTKLGQLYDEELSPEEIRRRLETDPNVDVDPDDGPAPLYNVLVGTDYDYTYLLQIGGSNGDYYVELDTYY